MSSRRVCSSFLLIATSISVVSLWWHVVHARRVPVSVDILICETMCVQTMDGNAVKTLE